MDKLIELVQERFLPKWVLVPVLVWLAIYLLCYLLGGIALLRFSKRRGFNKKLLPWLPGVQIYCEALFAGLPRTARRIQHCLWWWWVAAAGCLTTGVWLVAEMAGVEGIPASVLKIVLIALITVLVILYILIRGDELSSLKRIFQNPTWWGISVAGSIFCLPLQRVFLFFLTEEDEDEDEEDVEEEDTEEDEE